MQIENLKINKKIIKNLEELGYKDLTEIQEAVIEPILNNQNVLAQAQTGSGKTAAFLLPIIEKISNDRSKKALVVAPTRDLANQIFDNAIKYAKFIGLRCAVFFGGSSYSKQISFLESGIDIIIGTPGRLLDLQKRGNLDLSKVNYLVLDEADQMLDMGFIGDVRNIIKCTGELEQISLFSATIPTEIMKFVKEIMPEHVTFKVQSKININDVVKQSAYIVLPSNKPRLLLDIIGSSERTNQQAIVFARTRNEVADIASFLKKQKIDVEALHSDRSQSSRSRALKMFRNNEVQILVATNVAARGIDINDLPLVINYNLPENKETYVHRIGRTGRVGKSGEAISFITKNDRIILKDIERLIKMEIPVIEEEKYITRDPENEFHIRESNIKRGGGSSGGGEHRPRSYGGSSGGSSWGPKRSFNRDGGGGFRKDRGDFKGGDGEFKKDRFSRDRGDFKEGDSEFKKDRGDFKGGGEFRPRSYGGSSGGSSWGAKRTFNRDGGSGFRKDRGDFKGGDGEFKKDRFSRDRGDFKGGDGEFKKDRGAFKPEGEFRKDRFSRDRDFKKSRDSRGGYKKSSDGADGFSKPSRKYTPKTDD